VNKSRTETRTANETRPKVSMAAKTVPVIRNFFDRLLFFVLFIASLLSSNNRPSFGGPPSVLGTMEQIDLTSSLSHRCKPVSIWPQIRRWPTRVTDSGSTRSGFTTTRCMTPKYWERLGCPSKSFPVVNLSPLVPLHLTSTIKMLTADLGGFVTFTIVGLGWV